MPAAGFEARCFVRCGTGSRIATAVPTVLPSGGLGGPPRFVPLEGKVVPLGGQPSRRGEMGLAGSAGGGRRARDPPLIGGPPSSRPSPLPSLAAARDERQGGSVPSKACLPWRRAIADRAQFPEPPGLPPPGFTESAEPYRGAPAHRIPGAGARVAVPCPGLCSG